MQADDDILSLLIEKGAQVTRQAHRAVILQPGAIGDCILTLPLVEFMKDSLRLGGVDILGHTEYIGILPGRTCVDGIRSMDSMDLHRLFAETEAFDLADRDPLIDAFADYAWITTFLGEPNSNFEQNLIFTANCSHSAEVITLSMKPPEEFRQHVTDFYMQQFIDQSGLSLRPWRIQPDTRLIKATEADINRGRELLREIPAMLGFDQTRRRRVDFPEKLVVIHPGSGGLHKCWHIDNFLAAAKELILEGIEVIFLLGPAELERFSDAMFKNISSVAKCLTDLSLTQVLGLLSCADGFVGNDSGITHLAAGLGVRTLAVFGPTNPTVYRPLGPAVKVFADGTAAFAEKPSASLQQELLEVLMA
jgi:ADP-heptose:LPS heptosyltransferase